MGLQMKEKNVEGMGKNPETGFLSFIEIPSVIITDDERDFYVRFTAEQKSIAEKTFMFLQSLEDEEFAIFAEKIQPKKSMPTGDGKLPSKYRRHLMRSKLGL